MEKTALMFAGQGAQVVGMGKDLAQAFPSAKAWFDRANSALGYDLAAVCFQPHQHRFFRRAGAIAALVRGDGRFLRNTNEKGVELRYLHGRAPFFKKAGASHPVVPPIMAWASLQVNDLPWNSLGEVLLGSFRLDAMIASCEEKNPCCGAK